MSPRWVGEAKGSLVAAVLEIDPEEKQCRREFVLHLEIADDGEDGTGGATRPSAPGGREHGCCSATMEPDGSLHLSLNTGDVTITPL